jgi:hypothetical protein
MDALMMNHAPMRATGSSCRFHAINKPRKKPVRMRLRSCVYAQSQLVPNAYNDGNHWHCLANAVSQDEPILRPPCQRGFFKP